jgi:hypothetical protein
MEAPSTIEMAKRGETPFDMEVSKAAAVAQMAKKEQMLQQPEMLEMEPYYVNDLVTCDPHKFFTCDTENACIVNPNYDIAAICNGKYFTEGCHLAAPQTEGMHNTSGTDASGKQRDQSTVPVEELRPLDAGCCYITSLYCSFPGCIGCTGNNTVLCCMRKYSCLKCLPNPGQDEDKRCCAVVEQQSYLKIPNSLCEGQSQCCCLDTRCALPCTPTVPCLVTECGLTCFADWKMNCGCCKTVGELIPRLKPEN